MACTDGVGASGGSATGLVAGDGRTTRLRDGRSDDRCARGGVSWSFVGAGTIRLISSGNRATLARAGVGF